MRARMAAAAAAGEDLSQSASPTSTLPESYAIRLNNLEPQMIDDDLRLLCERFGKITRLKVVKDMRTNECKGYGFVNFESQADAERAVARLNGYCYGHVVLKAELMQPQQQGP